MSFKILALWLVVASIALLGPSPMAAEPRQAASSKAHSVVQEISEIWALDRQKLISKIGRNHIFGRTGTQAPLVAISGIVGKVFEDNYCRTRYICQIGASMSYYEPYIQEGLQELRETYGLLSALLDGVEGRDCDSLHGRQCWPTLKRSYRALV